LEHLTAQHSSWSFLKDCFGKVSQELFVEQTELSIHSSIVKVLEHRVEGLQEDWMEHKTLAVKSCTQELKTQQDRKSHVNAHLTNHTHLNKVILTQRNQRQRHLGTLKVAYAGHLQSPPPHIRVAEWTNHAQESRKVSVNMGQITARDLADKLIDGWVMGKYGVEFSNAMVRATLLTGQQVTFELVSEGCLQQQCTLGPWLSQIETPEIVSP
jgi:hypothetical protein